MTTLTARALLDQFEEFFGRVNVIDQGNRFLVTHSHLVELRGDGLRRSVMGVGETEDAALEDLWTRLTDEDSFVSVAHAGVDYNYGWTGKIFIPLRPLKGDDPQVLVDTLREYRRRT